MADATVTFAAKDLNLGSTIDKLKKELGATEQAAQNSSKGFDMSFGKIGLAAGVAGVAVKAGMMAVEAATAAAAAVVAGFGQAIDLGGELTDLSSRTGETAGNLLVLQRAFENTGVGAEKVGTSINKMQKFIAEASAGGEEQTATLNALGISMSDLAGKTPSDQMQVLAQKIAGISDPAQRARASMEIFGKSGGELLPLLNNFSGELEGARGQLGSLPDVMDRSARAMDDLGDNFDAIKTKTMEFAAGFIEKALPSLNAFTKSLSGIDAAGWGQALMKQVMSVSDFLLGAFKAPLPAIEALGLALIAGVKTAGNNYLNSLIDAGNFLKTFFSSDLPGLIAGQLGNSLIKMVVDFSKYFVDSINSVVKGFEQFFGAAIESVVGFFSNSFNRIVNAFAADFKNAMSDPIGFVTGKFNSALAAVNENGAMTFKTSFDAAGGSVLDKISAGLGSTSDMYGERLKNGTAALTDEFNKVVDSFEKSDRDIFGAKETSAAAAEKFKEVEGVGTKLREDFEKSADAANKAGTSTSGAAVDAEAIAGSFNKSAAASSKIKEDLSLSAKLLKDIGDAETKNAVDKGGRLQNQAQEQIQRGDFSGARRTADKIAQNEMLTSITGTGPNRDTRSLSDIGKQYGVSQQLGEEESAFIKRLKDVREGYATADRFGQSKPIPGVDRPGQDGMSQKDKEAPSQKSTLETLVEKIKDLVEKIEPRLPVAALTA